MHEHAGCSVSAVPACHTHARTQTHTLTTAVPACHSHNCAQSAEEATQSVDLKLTELTDSLDNTKLKTAGLVEQIAASKKRMQGVCVRLCACCQLQV